MYIIIVFFIGTVVVSYLGNPFFEIELKLEKKLKANLKFLNINLFDINFFRDIRKGIVTSYLIKFFFGFSKLLSEKALH